MQTTTTPTATTAAAPPVPVRRAPAHAFARHYAEMLAAMFLGMFVLGATLTALLAPAGVDAGAWDADAPALFLAAMAITMTVPMVAWMRYRGHRWLLCWEMSAAMLVPTLLAIGLYAGDAVASVHAAMGIQHAGMFPAMLGVMVLRRREYSGAH
jgi:hypothetical protein